MKKLITLLLTTTLLSACGWHLRGSSVAIDNIDSIYLSGSALKDPVLLEEMAIQIQRSGIQLTESATDAEFIINLSNDRDKKRTASVGSNALASEYELNMSVDFRISKGQQIIVDKETARGTRTFDFDTNQVLGKNHEEQLIRQEIRSDMIQHILRRLQYMASNPSATEANGQTAP